MFTNKIAKSRRSTRIPDPIPTIERVSSLNILGVVIQDDFSVHEHISNLVSRCNSTMYGLKTLKSQDLPLPALSNVCRATLISKILYASPAWIGFASADDKTRLVGVAKRANRWGLTEPIDPTTLLEKADIKLFKRSASSPYHVLCGLFPRLKLFRTASDREVIRFCYQKRHPL